MKEKKNNILEDLGVRQILVGLQQKLVMVQVPPSLPEEQILEHSVITL